MNILNTPPVTKDTKVVCFDIESNGLHGEAFALAGVVASLDGTIVDSFQARCPIPGPVDEWVQHNVLPAILDMPVTHSSARHMRDHFWSWFLKARKKADYVLVQNGYPVEYRFLIQCQEDDLDNRYWEHPFPVLDLTSLLVARRLTTNEVKKGVIDAFSDKITGSPHHPLYDATLSALSMSVIFADN